MKDLRPKIKKVLLETLKDTYNFGDYTIYEKDDHIMRKNNEADDFEIKRGWDDEALCWIPPFDHNEAFCFITQGEMVDLMNPCYSDYPNYDFEDTISNNFEKVGLFLEPYSSGRFDISLDQ